MQSQLWWLCLVLGVLWHVKIVTVFCPEYHYQKRNEEMVSLNLPMVILITCCTQVNSCHDTSTLDINKELHVVTCTSSPILSRLGVCVHVWNV